MVALCRMTEDQQALGGRTVYDVLEETAARYPARPALQQPLGGGKYRAWTWREYCDTVRQIAVGLREIGVTKGDIVALQSETRAEFYLADMGVMAAGAIAAALYTSLPFGDQAGTLRASGARVVLVENVKAMRALESAAGDVPLEVSWILLTGESEGVLTLEQLARHRRAAAARRSGSVRPHPRRSSSRATPPSSI